MWLIPLTSLLTILLVAKGLLPLIELVVTVPTRSANDLRPIESLSIYAETKPLVNELDSLLIRLNATLKRERNFLANAVQELRTPLAVIQVQADVLSNSESLAEKTEASNELSLGIERTAVLINKLLMMAKVDPDNSAGQFKPIELSGLRLLLRSL
jgi:signal transduction histidine kinase